MIIILLFILACIVVAIISFMVLSIFAQTKTGMSSEGSAIKCLVAEKSIKSTTIFPYQDYANKPKISFEKYLGEIFGVEKCSIWNIDKKTMSQPNIQDLIILYICRDFWCNKSLEYRIPDEISSSYFTPYGFKSLKNNLENIARTKYNNFCRLDITSSVWADENIYVSIILQ